MDTYFSYLFYLCIPVSVLLILSFLVPVATNAQFGFTSARPEIVLDPRFPESGDEVSVRLTTHTFNQFDATISWFIDGVEVTDAKNQTTFTTTAGSLGDTSRIQAFVSGSDINTTVERVLRVYDIDIIIEADTIIPAFYEGRALPSAGSKVTAVALPQLGTTPTSNLFYTWQVDNEVLFGGPQRGKSRAEIPFSRDTEKIVSVEISTPTDGLLVRKSMLLEAVDPVTHFYVDNPLRGTSELTVTDEVRVAGAEVGIRAVPYYMSNETRDVDAAEHEWNIDGRQVENPSLDPFVITLRRETPGISTLMFAVQNLQDFLQHARGEISVIFDGI